MPDVILWMISGEKRIAYYRIPANDLLYCANPDYIGKHCGKVQSIQLKVIRLSFLFTLNGGVMRGILEHL
jgi:hypothetical protein